MFIIAAKEDFTQIRNVYWDLIDSLNGRKDSVLWTKNVYPDDTFLMSAISNEEMYILCKKGKILACAVVNNRANEEYKSVKWQVQCENDDAMIIHALCVCVDEQRKGYAEKFIAKIIEHYKSKGKKAIRLDILSTNIAAEKLYTKCGFTFIEEKNLTYPDTGTMKFRMYEKAID